MAENTHDLEAAVVSDSDRARHRRPSVLGYVPGFVYILILYIIGKFVISDPRATLFDILGYKLSWVEVLLLAAAIVAMTEQIKVAKPGVNNTTEVLLMGAMAIIQLLLFSLGAAKVQALGIFDNRVLATHTDQPCANRRGLSGQRRYIDADDFFFVGFLHADGYADFGALSAAKAEQPPAAHSPTAERFSARLFLRQQTWPVRERVQFPLMAPLRHADGIRKRLLIGVDRSAPGDRQGVDGASPSR